MQDEDAADEARRRLDGSRASDRPLVVMTARERAPR
jgi:hypothetical protein